MDVKFGNYKVKAHELDNKLIVQFVSDLGKVSISRDGEAKTDFPNSIVFNIDNPSRTVRPKQLKKISFGLYKFILGVNFEGELVFFHSPKLNVGRKVIDGQDTLSLSLLKEPK